MIGPASNPPPSYLILQGQGGRPDDLVSPFLSLTHDLSISGPVSSRIKQSG